MKNRKNYQLDLIKDQEDRQLDLIGKMSMGNTQAIDFYDGTNKRLRDLAKRVRKETNENFTTNKIFSVTISNKTFDFNRYTNLANFGSRICNSE